MKVRIIGKVHREGVSKKSGRPYDFIELHYTGPAHGVIGEAALTKTIDPSLFNFDELAVPAEYQIEYDSTGAVVSLAPTQGR